MINLMIWIHAICLPTLAVGQSKDLPLPVEKFKIADRPAFMILPEKEKQKTPQPWILYAPTLSGYPDRHEQWMHQQFLNAGVAIAGVDIGEAYGSPKGREVFSKLYQELTMGKGFAKKPCLFGRSRGGLWVSSWAIENTDKVSGIIGVYPVFDFRTYPGLAKAASAYDLSAEELSKRSREFNPIERVDILAKAGIPIALIHGDEDKVVPLKENSEQLSKIYQVEGKEPLVKLIILKGQGHNFFEGFFKSQELVDFAIEKAKSGK